MGGETNRATDFRCRAFAGACAGKEKGEKLTAWLDVIQCLCPIEVNCLATITRSSNRFNGVSWMTDLVMARQLLICGQIS